MRLVDARPVGALDPRMTGDELARVINLDLIPVGQDLDLFPGQPVRDRVAVGLEGDKTVLGDVPYRTLLEDVGPPALAREKQILFLKEHLGGLAVGRAVDPLVGDIYDPLEKPGVEIFETSELFAPEEPLDVLNARLHLALGLGPVRPMGPRLEAVMSAEVPEDRVPLEARPRKVPAQHHRLQVVVEDLVRHPAQELEGLLVRAQEGGHLLVGRGDGVHLPAKAQGQNEQMDLRPFSRDDRPTLAPVGLALPPRRCFEPDRGFNLDFLPQRADVALDRLVASPVAPRAYLLEDRLSAVGHGSHSLEDVLLKGFQNSSLRRFPGIRQRRALKKDLPHRLDAQSDRSGNRLLRLLELESAVDLMPQFTFDHLFSSRLDCREEAYPLKTHLLTPFRSGGNFSMTTKG